MSSEAAQPTTVEIAPARLVSEYGQRALWVLLWLAVAATVTDGIAAPVLLLGLLAVFTGWLRNYFADEKGGSDD